MSNEKENCILCEVAPQLDSAAKGDRPKPFADLTHTELGYVSGAGITLVHVALGKASDYCDKHADAVALGVFLAVQNLPKPKAREILKKYGIPETWIK